MNYRYHYRSKYLAFKTLEDLPSMGLPTIFGHWYAYSGLPYTNLVQSKDRWLDLGFIYTTKVGVGCELEYKLSPKGSRLVDELETRIPEEVSAWLAEQSQWRANLPDEIVVFRHITLKKLLEPDRYCK